MHQYCQTAQADGEHRNAGEEHQRNGWLMRKEKIHATITMIGARTPMRMIIEYAFCRLVTSVVSRVMIEPVEKRSILVKL